jgi:hypothetical protein
MVVHRRRIVRGQCCKQVQMHCTKSSFFGNPRKCNSETSVSDPADAKETRPLTLLDVRLPQQITRPKSMGSPETLVGPSVLGSSMVRSVGASKSMTARALRAYRGSGKGRLNRRHGERFARFAEASPKRYFALFDASLRGPDLDRRSKSSSRFQSAPSDELQSITKATGWQAHGVRGFISGHLVKKNAPSGEIIPARPGASVCDQELVRVPTCRLVRTTEVAASRWTSALVELPELIHQDAS